MCSFFNFVRCMNVCVTEQECRKWRKLSEILWWKVQDKCAMFNLYFTSQNMWFFSIHVNTMYYFLSGEHFCQISFQFFFFFHSKYNLNLFPQYLAKSNISNHGFWWPCSLLKLEVYKKNLLFIGISVKRPWTRELKIYDSIYSVYTAILIIVSRESSNCNIVYCLSFLLIVFFFFTLMLYLLCILNMELNDTDEQFYELIFFFFLCK